MGLTAIATANGYFCGAKVIKKMTFAKKTLKKCEKALMVSRSALWLIGVWRAGTTDPNGRVRAAHRPR